MFTASSRHPFRALHSRHRSAVALALCAAFTGQPSSAQQPLSLEVALRLAQERSRQLPAQEAAAAAARDMAVAAGELPDPTLEAGINNLPINGADRFNLTRDFMTMRSVGLMQEFTSPDKLEARSARFEREAEVAVAARTMALATLRRDTAMAWLDRHYFERMRDLLRLQRGETTLQIEAAEVAYRGGRGVQADVFAARSAVAQFDDRIRLTDQQVVTATTRLSRWVGTGADQPLAPPPGLETTRFDDAGLETRIDHHPQLELLARQEAVARAEAQIARTSRRSDWSVELMYSQRGSAYSNMVSLNVAIPLQWDRGNRQDRELSARLALAEQLRAQREEATREHLAETRGWLLQWQSNRKRLEQYDATLIALAAESTRAAIAAYRGGGGSLTSVLDARRMEIDVRMERLRLEMETAGLWARLEYLIPAEHQAPSTTGIDSPQEQQR